MRFIVERFAQFYFQIEFLPIIFLYLKIMDEEGNDVTPEKLRQVQREKGLHGRSLDDPNS